MITTTVINKIINTISNYKDGYYTTQIINNFIVKINIENENPKYLVFEPIEIYQKIDELTDFLTALEKMDFENNDILRIPFFAGCSGYDIGYFITGTNISIDKNLDQKISFDSLPVDFNIYGLDRFLNYVDMLYNDHPIFKSNNNFSSYIEYFEGIINDMDGKINIILPIGLIKRSTDTPFLKTIISNYEKNQLKRASTQP